ncbi:ABC transporter ATP-binding protein/permease [Gluconacetobacter sacchari]|uniref:ABC transporter ATP-binding protein/permease n=1 Tax=Gluconacetobacter sacchari TaxID=92759 RepID=A0A7W4NQD7_9PROT|nr:SbmA/BacA-like family transporter [Gluconacetobacter sacchari]MBB2162312.1 ABC transporter ATP-binding protein/permease [Gluconacetobacter sacchari]
MSARAGYGSSTSLRPRVPSWRHSVQPTDETPPHSLSDWKVLLPYWVSEEKWQGLTLLAGIVALSFLSVQTAVWFGKWDQRFFDAFFAFKVAECIGMLPVYVAVIFVSVGIHVTQTYMTQILSMRWRLWNTRVYLRQYLSHEAYYRLEHGLEKADNPDQRIADDLSQMTIWALRLGLDAIQAVTTLLSFSVVLWEIGGALTIPFRGHDIHVPGYLFLGTVAATLLASLILEKFGAPLVDADYRQQHFDADLRAGLLDIRRNSEQIAFYGGEDAENARLSTYLSHIATNWRSVVTYTWRANFVSGFFNGTATIILWLLLMPKLMAHALTFGLYSRINAAFMQVRRSLQWFIDNYTDLATLRSILQRLSEFERIMAHPFQKGITRHQVDTRDVEIRDLVLNRPDGTPIASIASLVIRGGERWMIVGPSGAGKSTLLRAMAGLWGHGSGDLFFDIRHAMFLPQRSYMPAGTLRQALSYPLAPGCHDGPACGTALTAVNLGPYVARLDEDADWPAILSPGEQQRLAAARALLLRPRILFLDEATSALDDENERLVYDALTTHLAGATIISVAHHAALRRYHQCALAIGPGYPRAERITTAREA